MVNGGKAAFGDDLVDEGLKRGRGWCDLEGLAEHGFGFVEERFVFAEEGDEGLADFYLGSEFGVDLDAGVGADGVAWFGASCAETLDGPAYLFAIHGGEVAG